MINDIILFLQKYPFFINLFSGILGGLSSYYTPRFYRNFLIDLDNHTVFSSIQEARLLLKRIDYKNRFREETIMLWHNIVLNYQTNFCLSILKEYNHGARWRGDFKSKIMRIAQDQLNDFTERLQEALPEKLERKYSLVGYVARDQLRDAVFNYALRKGLTDKERVLGIFLNVEFYCNYVFEMANHQNGMNGELKNIPFISQKTGEELLD